MRVSGHVPMRLDDHRLVYQLEATFGATDAFDREGPNSRRAGKPQADVNSQPLVDQADGGGVGVASGARQRGMNRGVEGVAARFDADMPGDTLLPVRLDGEPERDSPD